MKRSSNLLSGSDAVLEHRSTSKDLPEIGTKLYEPSSSWLEANRLRNALQERHDLINQPRIERDCLLCVGKWDSGNKRVVVVKKRRKELETYGHNDPESNLYILNPEEALFLVESNSLIILNNDVEVSVETCYALLLGNEKDECSFQQYKVFSHLSRLGYKLIRHKKPLPKVNVPKSNVPASSVPKDNRNLDGGSKVTVRTNNTNEENVVVIDDSSSEDDDDDIVILDVIEGSRDKDIIQIEDEDSRDSDIVFIDDPDLVELPLENWSYVHRSKFLSSIHTEENPIVRLDPLIISQSEQDILDEIPNVKGHKSWLFRQDEFLLPHGVWPFHYKYLIDLDEQKNWNNRGRGGFRGRRGFRGRGYYLQRQVSQMKNYTISLMNMVSQLIGGQGIQVLPPPPAILHGPNHRRPRGHLYGRVSWGRVSSNNRGSGYRVNNNNMPVTEMIELSDDEEKTEDNKRLIKKESFEEEDVKPKKLKLEFDETYQDVSLKIEPMDLKIEPNLDIKPDLTSVTIKTENQVKVEKDTAVPSSSSEESLTNQSIFYDAPRHTAKEASPSVENGINSKETTNPSSIEKESSSTELNKSERQDASMFTNNEPLKDLSGDLNPTQKNNNVDNLRGMGQTDLDEPEKTNVEVMETESIDTNDKHQSLSSDLNPGKTSGTDISTTPPDGNENISDNDKSPAHVEEKKDSLMNKNCLKQNEKTNPRNECSTNGNKTDNLVEENKAENFVEENIIKENEAVNLVEENSIEGNKAENPPEENVNTSVQDNSNNLEKMQVDFQQNESVPINGNSTNPLSSSEVPNSQVEEISEKKTCWKELKESDGSYPVLEEGCDANESVEEQAELQEDSCSPLIEPRHCTSLDDVLKRLSIFKEFKSKVTAEKDLVVDVKYDVYLPTNVYYRKLPPNPDLRVIILSPEDPLPDANQMSLLKQIYNDSKNFLFAVVLPESIAYYLYDTVYLPVDSEKL